MEKYDPNAPDDMPRSIVHHCVDDVLETIEEFIEDQEEPDPEVLYRLIVRICRPSGELLLSSEECQEYFALITQQCQEKIA
jgi:hypothetical protein